jgi:two-component system sensor histidine kinase UhpB
MFSARLLFSPAKPDCGRGMRLRLNLKQRLLLLITAAMTALCAAGGAYIVTRAKNDTRSEMRSATDLVQRYLLARLELASVITRRDSDALPALDLVGLRSVRHVKVTLYSAAGVVVETSVEAALQRRHAPTLFAQLIERSGEDWTDTRIPVVLAGVRVGEVVIHPDASYETDEIWNVARGLLGLLLMFYLVSMALIWWAAARALQPLALVRSALQRLGAGHLDERLPAFSLPELASVSGEFNRMADTLQNSAVENQRLTRQLIRAQEDERARIARELHDEIGQCVTAIHADAVAIERGAARDSATAIVAAAAQIKTLLRGMLQRLQPAALDELGLGVALRELIAGFRQRHADVRCELRLAAGVSDLRGDVAIAAYRVVQESLTNIARHAQAGTVDIQLGMVAARPELMIRIADDGIGFDTGVRSGGFGLAGMRERVRSLGGVLTIESRPDDGTRIVATLPVQILSVTEQP